METATLTHTLILLVCTLLPVPADDAVVPHQPALSWAAVADLVAHGELDAAREQARRATAIAPEDPLLTEQAQAWLAWLEAARALPATERAELIALHARIAEPGSVTDELAALELLLARRPELVPVPHPDRSQLALTLAQRHRAGGRRALAAERLALASDAADARWSADHPLKATLLVERAAQLQDSARLDEAGETVAEARALLERGGWTSGRPWILTLNQQALLANAQGRADGALDTWRELVAATADPASSEHGSHLLLLLNLASRLAADGQTSASRAVCQRLLQQQLDSGALFPSRAHTLQLVAGTFRRDGQLAQAEQTLREALAELDAQTWGEPPALRGQLLAELGLLAARQGRPEEALAPLELAADLVLAARGPHHRATFSVRQSLAHTLMDLHHYERCRAVLHDMLAGDPPASQAAEVLSDMGRLLTVAGDEQAALEVLAQAASLARQPGVNGPLRTIEHTWGYALLRLERYAEAVSHLRAATTLMELQRPEPGSALDLGVFGVSPYPTLATALLRAGDRAAAWDAVERGNARSLLDQLTHRWREPGLAPPVSAPLARAAEVAAVLTDDEALIGWHDGPSRDLWCWVLRADGALRWFNAGMLSEALPGPPPSVLAEHHARLQQPLFGAVRATDDVLQRETSRRLWDLFIAPALPALTGVRRLVVVPPDTLSGVPVESFLDGAGRWLADRWQVCYAPSGSVLIALREQVRDMQGAPRGLVLADPPYAPEGRPDGTEPLTRTRGDLQRRAAELPRLSGTRVEARGLVTRLVEPLLLLDRQASEQSLALLADTGELEHFDLLHLATHGRADPQLLERSELVLSQVGLTDPAEAVLAGDAPVDGRLTAREILRHWRLDAELVTLSACETAAGQPVRGGAALGLGQSFLAAGARNVLASQWQVDPAATALFMDIFYGRWLDDGAPLAEALQAARLSVRTHVDRNGRRPYEHPGYWAAFTLLGAGR